MISPFVIAAAATAFGPPASPQLIRDPHVLGARREAFGEPYDYEGQEWQAPWVFKVTGHPNTMVFFPAGEADKRYYVNEWKGIVRGKQLDTFIMSLETKRGKHITCEWFTILGHIKPSRLPPRPSRKVGTFEAFFARMGLQVQPWAATRIQDTFRAVRGYAFYQADVVMQVINCGYLAPDGAWSFPKANTPDSMGYSRTLRNFQVPRIGQPYRVTKLERGEIARMLAAKRPEKAKRAR